MTIINSTRYLFTKSGLSALHSFLDRKTLFAFDLDGTLAPIVDHPGNIRIPDSILTELFILNRQASVSIITGRSRRDAQLYLGFIPQHLIGNHGAEGLPGWEAKEDEFICLGRTWEAQLHDMLPENDRLGFRIENKGATVSVHYRAAQDADASHDLLLEAIENLVPPPKRVGGKYIENLIPRDAPDKGIAMLHLMRHTGCPKGFFAGDDVTDEAVFELSGDQLFTVRVGNKMKTSAQYYLQDQREIAHLLRDINLFQVSR